MQLKPIIQGLAVVWLLLFVVSFVTLQFTARRRRHGRVESGRVVPDLAGAAFIVAMIGAFAARYAAQRGVEGVTLFGYVPLALSVFLVASFIALMGFRFFVAPLFE